MTRQVVVLIGLHTRPGHVSGRRGPVSRLPRPSGDRAGAGPLLTFWRRARCAIYGRCGTRKSASSRRWLAPTVVVVVGGGGSKARCGRSVTRVGHSSARWHHPHRRRSNSVFTAFSEFITTTKTGMITFSTGNDICILTISITPCNRRRAKPEQMTERNAIVFLSLPPWESYANNPHL